MICLKPVVKKYCHHYNTGKIGFKLQRKTDDTGPKKVKLTNKVIRQALKCANSVARKSKFLKLQSNKKTNWDKINPNLLIY